MALAATPTTLRPAAPQAIAPADAEADFLVDRWTVDDGLPVNAVRRVHFGASGYLWLATHDGLVRFDGREFTTYGSAEAGRRLKTLLETPDGTLWVTNEVYQPSAFNGSTFRSYGDKDGLASNVVVDLRMDPSGVLWALSKSGLARWQDDRFQLLFEFAEDREQSQVLPLPDGRAWIGSITSGLFQWDGQALHRIGPELGVPASVRSLAVDETGRLWVGGDGITVRATADGRFETVTDLCGAIRIETLPGHVAIMCDGFGVDIEADGTLTRHPRLPRYNVTGEERLLATAPDGSVWRNRLDSLERNGRTVYSAPCTIADFDLDPTGAIWIATACEGLVRLRPRRIQALTESGGIALGAVYGVAQAPDGALWITTVRHGVTVVAADGSVRWLPPAPAGPPRGILPIWIGNDGETWIGPCHVDLTAWNCRRPPDWPTRRVYDREVRAVHRARDGTLWVGGWLLWRKPAGGAWEVAGSGLGSDNPHRVRSILESADGTLWFGTRGSGVLRRDPDGTFHRFSTADGLASNAIRGLREDRDGQLWIATEDMGLCRLRRHRSTDQPTIACLDQGNGLMSNSLHQILFDSEDRAWINSNQGVSAIPRLALDAALDSVAAGRAAQVQPQVFTEHDGLPDREGNGGVQGSGTILADGRIAFPTQNGVALIDPASMQPPSAPVRTVIDGIDLPGGRHVPFSPRIELARGERSFTLQFTGLAPGLMQPMYFRYRFAPDEAWIDLGGTRQLNLAHLAPGQHRLELQAFNRGGESGRTAAMLLVLPPYFYETTAFRVALPVCILLLLGVALLRHNRVGRLHRMELEATVAARTEDLSSALETVNHQRNEISRLAMTKNRFFANISHEFRTPLTLITGPLRDAANGHELAAGTRAIMLGNAQRLERLVTQLLDLERIDFDRFPLRAEDGDLSALVHESAEAFAPLARQQQVALRVACPPGVRLRHDFDQMSRVLGNLLSNALKFTPAGGSIDFTMDVDADRVLVAVADTGPGVPEKWRERIFDRFSQVGSEMTRSREGAGLGLAVCREIVRLHGGRLGVEPNPGGGARFFVDLPRRGEYAAVPSSSDADEAACDAGWACPPGEDLEAVPAQATAAPTRRRRVLVAEDHPELRAYIVSILEGEYQVIDVEDGEAALQLARSRLPDLIVSDVMMPRRGGFSLARELRRTPATAGIPLIFLSARASDADAIAGLSSGADQYLRKPFDGELLRAHVAAALHAVERLQRRFAEQAPLAATAAAATTVPSADRRFLAAAEAWLQAHLHDEAASIQQFAAALHVSRATLARRHAKLTGESPIAALRRMRLERARELLARGEGTVSEVAYAVGYSSLAAFSHAYHERFGHAPSLA
jgi:signal transduction histidine kinase/DNA-binding response OmpR family regulator/ligand-binding sensor domain-containing protein